MRLWVSGSSYEVLGSSHSVPSLSVSEGRIQCKPLSPRLETGEYDPNRSRDLAAETVVATSALYGNLNYN